MHICFEILWKIIFVSIFLVPINVQIIFILTLKCIIHRCNYISYRNILNIKFVQLDMKYSLGNRMKERDARTFAIKCLYSEIAAFVPNKLFILVMKMPLHSLKENTFLVNTFSVE